MPYQPFITESTLQQSIAQHAQIQDNTEKKKETKQTKSSLKNNSFPNHSKQKKTINSIGITTLIATLKHQTHTFTTA